MEAVRVLLVDDDALVRAGLTMMLGAFDGIEVAGAVADGTEVAAAVNSTALRMSTATVKAYVSRILTKLELTNRVQVALLVHDARQ